MKTYLLFTRNFKQAYYIKQNKKGTYVLYKDIYYNKRAPLLLRLLNINVLKEIYCIPDYIENTIWEHLDNIKNVKYVSLGKVEFVNAYQSYIIKPEIKIPCLKHRFIHAIITSLQ